MTPTEALNVIDQSYATKFAAESSGWIEMGAYDVVAKLAEVKDGQILVDIGSAFGPLAVVIANQLQRTQQAARIICVERSAFLVREFIQILENARLLTGAYMMWQPVLEMKDNKCLVTRDFILDIKQLKKLKIDERKNGVWIICDDVRSRKILDHALPKEIDAMTFTFPGAGTSAAYEAPYCAKGPANDAEMMASMRTVSDEVRRATYALASERVRAGGRLVVAERVPRPENLEDKASAFATMMMDQFSRRMKPFDRYWVAHETAFIKQDVRNLQGPLQWSLQLTPNSREIQFDATNMGATAFIVCLERNEVPFEQPTS